MSTSLSLDTRRQIMEKANARGLTVGGTPVSVAGARNAFATVSLVTGPFKGWSAEYSWPTIERATTGNGELR